MRPAASTCVVSSSPFHSLPFAVEHKSSRTTALLLMALLVPVLVMVILPLGLVLIFAADDLWQALSHKPLAASILGTGLAAWVALLLAAAKRLVQRFGNRRRVRIDGASVMVDDSSVFASSNWSAPLVEFSGIAHHVRATLSGVRHQLVLVHPEQELSVLLYATHAMPQSTIDHASRLFRLPQVAVHAQPPFTERGLESFVVEAIPEPAAA